MPLPLDPGRRVLDREKLVVLQVEPRELARVERPGAQTVRDSDLVAALVVRPIALVTLRYTNRGTARLDPRDELGRWRRTPAVIARRAGIDETHYLQTVLAVGHVGVLPRVRRGDRHARRVVEAPPRVVEARRGQRFRAFDVDDRESLRARRHVRVGAHEIEVARIRDRGLAGGRARAVRVRE